MDFQIVFQLFLATFLGGLIGLEREIKKREAGLQTYSLVALSSCLFTLSAISFFGAAIASPVILAIAIGMGFIGAGAIFRGEDRIEGVTTAAGLWTTAAIGLAVGIQLYFLATLATFLTLFILIVFGFVEKKFVK